MRPWTTMFVGAALTGCLVETAAPERNVPPRVQRAFDDNCVRDGCHDAATAKSGMSLEAGDSDAIIGRGARGSSLPLVEIGNLNGSYMAQKLLDDPDILGSQMPPDGGDPVDVGVILAWIGGVDFPGEELSFARDVWPILKSNCYCHRDPDDEDGSGPLELPDSDAAYENLVGMTAAYDAAYEYVRPGDLTGSYIWFAITGIGGSFVRMPADNPNGLTGTELQTIRDWILAGAEP